MRLAAEERHGAAASAAVCGLAFAATGVALTLPGAMLPLLLERWALTDARAGVLLFCFFAGSMLGAAASRGRLHFSVARGGGLVAAGAGAMALLGRGASDAGFAAMAVYGLGVGVVMTSVTLVESRAFANTRVARLARLNFLWAAGALFGPSIGLRLAARVGVPAVLLGMGAFFLLLAAAALLWVRHVEAQQASTAGWSWSALSAIGIFLLIVPLCTGIESAAGGWLSTYARRGGDTVSGAAVAVTCFWGGMLVSRLAQSLWRGASERALRRVLWACPLLTTSALLTAHASAGTAWMAAAAFVAGVGSGPMYPLTLALALRRGEGGNLIFLVAGIGSAAMPLLTGMVSTASGSLRGGLLVPAAGAAALLVACARWASTQRHRD